MGQVLFSELCNTTALIRVPLQSAAHCYSVSASGQRADLRAKLLTPRKQYLGLVPPPSVDAKP